MHPSIQLSIRSISRFNSRSPSQDEKCRRKAKKKKTKKKKNTELEANVCGQNKVSRCVPMISSDGSCCGNGSTELIATAEMCPSVSAKTRH